MTLFTAQKQDLERLADIGRLRHLAPRAGHDFSSNDYLCLANSAELRAAISSALVGDVPVGSGGSRLLRGNHDELIALEQEAAEFFGSDSALYFATGYSANSALLSTLPQKGDLIVHDALIHASAQEGMRLARAEYRAAAHNDVTDFERVISGWRGEGGTSQIWIAVESLYSMDGDLAPLEEFQRLAREYDAILLIDEAHATGVFGPAGRGLGYSLRKNGASADNIITLHTCGKALGCEGALVCGPKIIRDFLINRGRGFIFSTAPSPLMAAAVRAALRILYSTPERQKKLRELTDYAVQKLSPLGVQTHGSPIMPLILGAETRAMELASKLQAAGFDIRAIRPPTVPAGTSRLRISLTLNIGKAEIDALARILEELL